MKTRMLRAMLALTIGLMSATFAPAAFAQSPSPSASALMTRGDLRDAMRKLWEDHVTWTRLFLVSKGTLPDDLPDLGPTTDRLLSNQADIGNAIRPFYGDEAADQLTDLLREHITTAADLVTAAKAADTTAVDAASAAWYANADEIAAFLNAANPDYWPLDEMTAMMKQHLDLTLEEAVARLEGRYTDDISAYDNVHAQILKMADMLSNGIIKQFPDRFAE